jgi:hypothetical protein
MDQLEQFVDRIALVFSPDNIIRLAESNDPIGTVLHAHLMIEEFLVAWSEKQLDQTDLITGLKIGFDARLELAKRLGLDSQAVAAIKKIDQIRNRLGHRLGYTLEKSEVDSFADAVDAFDVSKAATNSCKDESIAAEYSDGRERLPKTHYANASTHLRFVIVFGALSRKLILHLDLH